MQTNQKIIASILGIAVLSLVVYAFGQTEQFHPQPFERMHMQNDDMHLTDDTDNEHMMGDATATLTNKGAYGFAGITWIFTQEGQSAAGAPLTRVRFQFKNFTENGKAITVAPFRLGLYQGSCAQIEPPQQDNGGNTLGFAQCWWAGIGKQIGLFKDGNTVTAKIRTVAEEDTKLDPLQSIFSLDITHLPSLR